MYRSNKKLGFFFLRFLYFKQFYSYLGHPRNLGHNTDLSKLKRKDINSCSYHWVKKNVKQEKSTLQTQKINSGRIFTRLTAMTSKGSTFVQFSGLGRLFSQIILRIFCQTKAPIFLRKEQYCVQEAVSLINLALDKISLTREYCPIFFPQ